VISNQSSVIGSDLNGNLTNDTTQAYAFDENNRLVEVAQASVPVGQYSYDALGRRISKTTTNGTTCFYYDSARIIEEQDCSGGTLATYTYGNYIDEVLTRTTNPGSPVTYYYHQNSLWSVHALTDATGNVVERYNYDAYGKLSVLDGNYQLLATAPFAYFTYTGREYDFESGLYHYRARTYSPILGRFFSRDPVGYVDGMTLHEYVRSNPINRHDPSGLKCDIALKCWRVRRGIPLPGKHCGLVIDRGSSVECYHGSGGGWNQIETGNCSTSEATGSFTAFPDSVCDCLSKHKDTWNAKRVSRDHICKNSNFTLKCALKNCGIDVAWGSERKPIGYNCQRCAATIPDFGCCIKWEDEPCP
jgi:RHS repeat-associated protein